MSSSSNSPCAACKFLRRKCTQECDFAPYFPPDNPKRFASVHKVFGASNVAKLLKELNPLHREDAVKSLAYEAEARMRDPVYGCVGFITGLQTRLKNLQIELLNAKRELVTYLNPQAMQYLMENPGAVLNMPHQHNQPPQGNGYPLFPNNYPNNLPPHAVMTGGGQLVMHEMQEQELLEAQQQLQNFQQQQEFLRFNSTVGDNGNGNGGGEFGLGQHIVGVHQAHGEVASALALGNYGNNGGYQIQQQQHQGELQHHVAIHQAPLEAQILLSPQHSSQPHQMQQQQQQQQQQQSETEDGRSNIGPSC